MLAFTELDYFGNRQPKTHFRRECEFCVASQCGCFLPFRRLSKYTRKHMAMELHRKSFIGGKLL
jgi:hypothetical protein